ncbi:hypothetical protein AQJ43_05945 [Streptomyces avermitilis]|uniref:DinB-like domain-containing protein n=2 Tax=Streptomyces avermitilis TaxID=33903 RepID=Q82LA7_STRAW|nr:MULTISPECIES: hypothetical protein [Streptomyces]KUN55647.1 hypothetical protein AQJ43_05945 [Streptomyces avermitilis]MYS97725.1 hypothetical protein [Streptomyces sp. SID5469]OOV24138.1 hypothetical protein SM007_30405 [Streptomyces avermitilis]BAC69815.1 hypothetical protein SAVERM_2104 [Streptomyces avermitilis MA-4680 = NBRC 14893]BBJ49868.1 hypothetical protein SAVMC3_24970 [Streptomyces avermitilis]
MNDSAQERLRETGTENPAAAVVAMVDHVLDLAATWTAWDGKPAHVDDRVYTPHKAIRRVTDLPQALNSVRAGDTPILDHLAELEARLVGEEPQPDHWHASASTTEADLAPFTPEDLDEARSRLTRLARIWANRLGTLTEGQLDDSPAQGWSFRRLAEHLEESTYYADAVGRSA